MVNIKISIQAQSLELFNNKQCQRRYQVSTAKNGTGNQLNSGCTPLGLHKIRLKIGAHCPENTVFVGRRPTGETYAPHPDQPKRDWILSRILWLTGCEPGINRGGSVDSLRRFIYIHGTPDTEPMGVPRSCGCIRMHNHDIIELFDLIPNQTPVSIEL